MKTVVKFGLISCAAIVVLFAFEFITLGNANYSIKEIFGYASIFIALAFVFFGVKSYRNRECEGRISFFKALFVGLLITLFPSVMFGIYNVVYVEYLDPGFMQNYQDGMIEQLKSEFSGDELAAKITETKQMGELFAKPLFNFALMAITVFLPGVIISVITAVTLRKS